jgi:hypothetical protein
MGDYPQGFKSFNWRWQGDELTLPDFTCPKWAGEPLQGKTLTIIPEQGFGDTVLMARFLPAVKNLGATIRMAVKPPLRRLFANIETIVDFTDANPSKENSDFWAPMMDLPLYLDATLKTLPKPASLFIPEDTTKPGAGHHRALSGPLQTGRDVVRFSDLPRQSQTLFQPPAVFRTLRHPRSANVFTLQRPAVAGV